MHKYISSVAEMATKKRMWISGSPKNEKHRQTAAVSFVSSPGHQQFHRPLGFNQLGHVLVDLEAEDQRPSSMELFTSGEKVC